MEEIFPEKPDITLIICVFNPEGSMAIPYLPGSTPASSVDEPCVRDATRELTYRELEKQAVACAGFFAERGVNPGDVVAIMLPNSVDFAIPTGKHGMHNLLPSNPPSTL